MIPDLRLALTLLAALQATADPADEWGTIRGEALVLESDASLGRRLLGDWEGSDALLVAFNTTWEDTLTTLATNLPPAARLILVLERGAIADDAERWLDDHGIRDRAEVLPTELNSPWVRDFAPFQVVDSDGSARWLDAYYGSDRPADDMLPRHLAFRSGVARVDFPERLDGGAIVANGAGLCASTVEAFDEAGLVTVERSRLRSVLDQLGCSAMALVPALISDKTKHADMFIQFVDYHRAVVASFDPVLEPEDARRMEVAVLTLREAAARLGQTLDIVRVPMLVSEAGEYATFINGLRFDDRFFAPTFSFATLEEETRAFDALQAAMPKVEIIPVDADSIIPLNGAIHCIAVGLRLSPQRPAVRSARFRLRPEQRRSLRLVRGGFAAATR